MHWTNYEGQTLNTSLWVREGDHGDPEKCKVHINRSGGGDQIYLEFAPHYSVLGRKGFPVLMGLKKSDALKLAAALCETVARIEDGEKTIIEKREEEWKARMIRDVEGVQV